MQNLRDSSFSDGHQSVTQDSDTIVGNLDQKSFFQKKKLMGLVLNAYIGSFVTGYVLSICNVAFPLIFKSINGDEELYDELLNIIFATGGVALAGAITSLFIGSKVFQFGRKNNLIVADLFAIIGNCIAMSDNTRVFIAAIIQSFLSTFLFNRVLNGIGVGINSIMIPTYLLEYASSYYGKGRLMVMHQFFFACGIMASDFWGLFIVENNDAESSRLSFQIVMFIIPVILPLIRIILLSTVFNKDTPYFYILNKNKQKAEKIILKYYNNSEALRLLEIFDVKYGRQIEGSSTLKNMMDVRYKQRFILGCLLNFICYFSGVFMIILYSHLTFESEINSYYSQIQILPIGIALLLSQLLQIFLTQVIGRKTCLLIGQSFFILGFFGQLIVQFFSFDFEINMVIIFESIVCVGFSFESTAIHVLLSEILPERGVAATHFISLTSISIGAISYPLIIQHSYLGLKIFFVCFCCLGWAAIYQLVKETRGLTSHQIELIYTSVEGNISNNVLLRGQDSSSLEVAIGGYSS